MKKAPYTFPLRSRAAIVDFLTRDGRAYYGTRYRFAWNVKAWAADFDGDSLRKHVPELDPALDSEWEAGDRIGDRDDDFWHWCEDAGHYISDGEWCSYPGDDQGDWQFAFAGRSGGWLVLEKWRGRDMRNFDAAELLDPEEWPFEDLRAFYRGIVCADVDFTPAKAAAEVEYQAAHERLMWEENRREEEEERRFEERRAREAQAAAMAADIAESRPDLAPSYA